MYRSTREAAVPNLSLENAELTIHAQVLRHSHRLCMNHVISTLASQYGEGRYLQNFGSSYKATLRHISEERVVSSSMHYERQLYTVCGPLLVTWPSSVQVH
jgi:hypothetical protein